MFQLLSPAWSRFAAVALQFVVLDVPALRGVILASTLVYHHNKKTPAVPVPFHIALDRFPPNTANS